MRAFVDQYPCSVPATVSTREPITRLGRLRPGYRSMGGNGLRASIRAIHASSPTNRSP